MSEKEGARVGVGRPSVSGRRKEVYLGTGAEVKQTRDCLKGRFPHTSTSVYLTRQHAAVPIQSHDKQQTENLALPISYSSSSTLILEHNMYYL